MITYIKPLLFITSENSSIFFCCSCNDLGGRCLSGLCSVHMYDFVAWVENDIFIRWRKELSQEKNAFAKFGPTCRKSVGKINLNFWPKKIWTLVLLLCRTHEKSLHNHKYIWNSRNMLFTYLFCKKIPPNDQYQMVQNFGDSSYKNLIP